MKCHAMIAVLKQIADCVSHPPMTDRAHDLAA